MIWKLTCDIWPRTDYDLRLRAGEQEQRVGGHVDAAEHAGAIAPRLTGAQPGVGLVALGRAAPPSEVMMFLKRGK